MADPGIKPSLGEMTQKQNRVATWAMDINATFFVTVPNHFFIKRKRELQCMVLVSIGLITNINTIFARLVVNPNLFLLLYCASLQPVVLMHVGYLVLRIPSTEREYVCTL